MPSWRSGRFASSYPRCFFRSILGGGIWRHHRLVEDIFLQELMKNKFHNWGTKVLGEKRASMTNAAHHVMLGEEAVEDTKQGPDGCFVAMGCHVAVAAMLLLYKQFSKTRAANIVRWHLFPAVAWNMWLYTSRFFVSWSRFDKHHLSTGNLSYQLVYLGMCEMKEPPKN